MAGQAAVTYLCLADLGKPGDVSLVSDAGNAVPSSARTLMQPPQ
jgi:hypothetical protein